MVVSCRAVASIACGIRPFKHFCTHVYSWVSCNASTAAGGLGVNSANTGVNSSSSDQTPVSDLRRLWAMVSKPDFGQAPADGPDEVSGSGAPAKQWPHICQAMPHTMCADHRLTYALYNIELC